MSANKLAPAMRRVFSAVGTFGDSSSSQSCIAHGDAQIPPRFRGRPAITVLSHTGPAATAGFSGGAHLRPPRQHPSPGAGWPIASTRRRGVPGGRRTGSLQMRAFERGLKATSPANCGAPGRCRATLPLLSDIAVRNNSPAARASKRDSIEPRQIPFLAPGLFISQTGLI